MARDLVAESVAPEGSDGKRFGTFLGVFAPSILTILGVIMYQRFGRVVGHAGMGGALLVVLLAHVISIATGLSVASIATNRTVRTGGNYYIISRSLGLSVGGAIGLAFYLALTLGVSLYLIGFAEALLGATGWQITGDPKDDLRIVGTVACVVISLLTLYSTEFALKSQLFVLGAIVLSLVSIAAGSGVPVAPDQTAVQMWGPETGASMTVVFAMFFPAVTGFTAGVGMSGDLKDPKRAIPLGTMAAIGAGLLIYLLLLVFISYRAPVEELIADKNILLRMAWSPELVTLGVFAATLSSALGSLLGAPRTLQALATDGIVPKFLSRGGSEPRVALVLTILIAEGGILIAELELVSAILSMFFLTCYGVLCLACGLERWASPDFRPQFKVPVWVSLVGAVACFMVMFQINALAMFGAIIVMLLVYAVLKRRQLVLSSGDTWGGVWSAVVRMGLLRLSKSSTHSVARNWRPNMVATSRDRGRSPLIDFGRAVVGDRGIMTHFHLVQGGPIKPTADDVMQANYPGLFARMQGCEDPFEAIPSVASNFGLAGMETNVVLIGWPRGASTNDRYSQMIDRLIELDISVLMLRVDGDRQFGRCERLDVWWDGVSPTGQLMLTLVHLLSTSHQWKNARIRVLVNGRPGHDEVIAKNRLDEVISDARIAAEGVLLPPLADSTALPDRVRQESAFADLIMVHAGEANEDQDFVPNNDALLASLGTALLVRPASTFDDAPAIFDMHTPVAEVVEPTVDLGLEELAPAFITPVLDLAKRLDDAASRFAQTVQTPSLTEEEQFLADVQVELQHIRRLPGRMARRGARPEAARGLVDWAQGRFGEGVAARAAALVGSAGLRKADSNRPELSESAWQMRLRLGLVQFEKELADAAAALPEEVAVVLEGPALVAVSGDGAPVKLKKAWSRTVGRGRCKLQVPLRSLGLSYVSALLKGRLGVAVGHIGTRRYDALGRARRLVGDVDKCFSNLRAEFDQSADEPIQAEALRDKVRREVEGLERVAAGVSLRFHEGNKDSVEAVRDLVRAMRQGLVEALADPWAPTPPVQQEGRSVQGMPTDWATRHVAQHAALRLDVQGAALQAESRRSVFQLVTRLRRELSEGPLTVLATAERAMRDASALLHREPSMDKERASETGSVDLAPAANDSAEQAELQKSYVIAADELRATWEREYRPAPAEFIDQLVSGLARAAERLPVTVTTLDEARGRQADGLPRLAAYPVRRLAQAFLEAQIVRPAREALGPLPEEVRKAEEVLVDAVRLVAFELEHVGGESDGREDEDVGSPQSLAVVIEDRAARLVAAKATLEAYAESVRARLLNDAGRALSDARAALTGSTGLRVAPAPRVEAAGAEVAQGVRKVFATAKRRLTPAVARLSAANPHNAGGSGGLVDDLLALRDNLDAHSRVHAELPLVYRRVFGRLALETSGLLVGRRRQVEQLGHMVQRWQAGSGGPVGIIGDPRSGRTTLANILGREFLPAATVVRVVAPPGRAADADMLNAAVVSAVGAREGQSAEGALRAMPPGAMVVLDELGRWMERAPKGLSAVHAWRRLWRRLGARHFFVVTATGYAWQYVDSLVDLSGSFLGTVQTSPLAPADLVGAIQLRQRTSEFELAFEGHSARSRRAQRQQLLQVHQRSGGNVGIALDIWRRSVTKVSSRRVTVSIESPPSRQPLLHLPLRWYAGLAAVLFHKKVIAARMATIMRLPREDATALLQDLERAGLLAVDAHGVYTPDAIMAPLILEILRTKEVLR